MPAGRPRKLPVDELLDAVTEPFLRNGLHATSISDLERASGLSKGSLYMAFASKREMFIAALERALADFARQLQRADVPAWMRAWSCDPQDMHAGAILVVRTAAMASYDDPDVRRVLAGFLDQCRTDLAGKLTSKRAAEVMALAQGFAVEALRSDRAIPASIRETALANLLA